MWFEDASLPGELLPRFPSAPNRAQKEMCPSALICAEHVAASVQGWLPQQQPDPVLLLWGPAAGLCL